MSKIINYKLLNHTALEALETVIQENLNDGWQPLGTPFTFVDINGDRPTNHFCQAMIKLENRS